MKEKIDCTVRDMEVEIKRLLKQPISEADSEGEPIEIIELKNLLKKRFEFSNEELCEALNNLGWHDNIIRIFFKIEDVGEELNSDPTILLTIDKIALVHKPKA